MYIATIPNRNSPPAILLREGFREGGKVKSRTIANISKWPAKQIEALRLVLQGKDIVAVDEMFETVSSSPHGHVQAVLGVMEKLGFAKLLDSRPSKERDLVTAMIAWRIISPSSKLATQRSWRDSTLPKLLNVEGATEDDLYGAMDWLLSKQDKIEKALAKRHLKEDGLVLYDLSSSYFEGTTCPLAKLGYNRDGKNGKLQVNYGLLADGRGCPVSISVFEGNVGDPKTLMSAVDKVRTNFGVKHLALVGDRGMISQKQIDEIKEQDGIAWITALKTGAIRSLVEGGAIQLGLFDERNLFEFEHGDYPGERLVACRNPELAKLRAHKRQSLIDATVKELQKVRGMVEKGKLKKSDVIGVRVGKVVNKYKVAKHFKLDIEEGRFEYFVIQANVDEEAKLDGIYVVRTSLKKEQISTEDTVRNYKKLSQVERAFRSLKTIDLKVRPIHHRDEDRVRAHIFLCMLSYYVEWHMHEALRPLLFSDEDLEAKTTRDPIAPAKRSASALAKAKTKKTAEGFEAHSFRTLIDHLGTIVRNFCKRRGANDAEGSDVTLDSTPNDLQQRALELLKSITM
jgi:transposase